MLLQKAIIGRGGEGRSFSEWLYFHKDRKKANFIPNRLQPSRHRYLLASPADLKVTWSDCVLIKAGSPNRFSKVIMHCLKAIHYERTIHRLGECPLKKNRQTFAKWRPATLKKKRGKCNEHPNRPLLLLWVVSRKSGGNHLSV